MKLSNEQRADILIQALPYIQKYNNKIVVIKYGGSAMQSETLKKSVMRDSVLLSLIGIKVELVQGGGAEITEALNAAGKKTEFIDGLRVTDAETAEIVQMVLSGKINKGLVNLIQSIGGSAIGLSGADGHMISAKTLDKRLGFVGEITEISTSPITDLLEKGYIPIIATVGCDNKGNIYNINADTAAAKIAEALKAESLISMTDTKGILNNKDDGNSLIPEIKVKDADKLISQGIISGGMIPKIDCCIAAIKNGVKKVVIIDGRVPHAILIEILTDEGIGTMFI